MSKQQANYQKRFAVMHNPAVKAEIAALDPVRDCQRIVQLLVQYEFAWDITRSLEIALIAPVSLRNTAKNATTTQDYSLLTLWIVAGMAQLVAPRLPA